MMAELREMARAPMAVFERFMGELQRLTADKTIAASVGLERVKGLQAQTVREFEESLERFRARAEAAEAALVELLRPHRPNLSEQIRRATQHLQHLRDLEARRAALLPAWEQQPAEAILEAYRDMLERNHLEVAELIEADVEDLLRRKGSEEALRTYLHMRARAEENRLGAAQRQARADLEEIGRLKHELEMATRILASTLKVSGSLAAAGAGWRRGSRVRLAPGQHVRIPLFIFPGPHPAMAGHLVDVSRTGARVTIPQELLPGALITFVVAGPGPEGGLRMRGEVRWCRVDVDSPGRFLAGVRLASRVSEPWIAMVTRLGEKPTPNDQ